MPTRYILSIDGGGMYGVVPAQWSVLIEQETGRAMAGLFDLMVGTSTGSVLTAGFSTGISGARALDLYQTRGPDIFKNPRPFLLQLFKPKYRAEELVEVLGEYYGDTLLGQVHPLLMITAFNMSTNIPAFFKSWKAHEEALRLLDVVVASSSAPTFHPMHEIGGQCYTDGGVFAVDPAASALAEARLLWPEDELVLVSLGTGLLKTSRDCRKVRQWGLIKWAPEIPDVFLEGQRGVVTYQLKCLGATMRGLLAYFRFDIELTRPKRSDETDPAVLQAVADQARRYAEDSEDFAEMIALLKDRAGPAA